MSNSITTNLITSYKVMKKSQYENYKKNMTSKDVHIVKIIENFSNKPRFSIDMVQNELLKVSKHFTSEKNTKKEVTSNDIAFIKDTFKVCFFVAMEKNIYFDFALQNGVVTFLKAKTTPFTLKDDNANGSKTPQNESDKLKDCFEKCKKSIKWEKIDNITIDNIINELKALKK